MGSFSYTCSVSNLPIVAGTPVRFFALMQRPYDTPACYIDAFWVPLSLPLQGVYNDYGSIEDITSPKEIRDLFFQALREYAVERGIGSNSVHDVAVHKDMNEDEWLEALWEGRVLVRDPAALRFGELDVFLKPGPEPLGFPTLKSVEDAISKEGHKVTRRGYSEGYYVEELRLGYVRVRTDQEFGKEVELLSRLKLENFATVIMMSPERPNGADLLVVPKPGQERGFGIAPIGQSSLVDPQTFQVAQAMIREDRPPPIAIQPLLLPIECPSAARYTSSASFARAASNTYFRKRGSILPESSAAVWREWRLNSKKALSRAPAMISATPSTHRNASLLSTTKRAPAGRPKHMARR